ncbi:MAG: response regulator [Methylococcales bacterium]|jgi:two-component system, sensor histidine kinase|nr:response regulator [Methylococcales bacterium]MBT7408794.1 response regulator [Methylococcales bacterium]
MEKPNILMVDDRSENLLALSSQLDDIGANIITANSGNEALILASEQSFVVILMDVQMPEMDGFETASILQSENSTKHIPIIFVTAINQSDTVQYKGYQSGAVDFLFKPINPFILKSKISVFLALYRQNQQLAQQAEELTLLNEKVESASHAKSAFLANMSHEIRTPLNAISGISHLLATSAAPADQEQDLLNRMQQTSKHLTSLIGNILDFSKIESGFFELTEEPFELNVLFKELLSILQTQADEKNLYLKLNIKGNTPNGFLGDSTRIKQIFYNLIGNCLKFVKQGGITVSIAFKNEMLVIDVKDTGDGIPESQLKRIFSAFEQDDAGRKNGGTGLGLAISLELSRLMGGNISVASILNQGTTFSVELKLKQNKTKILPQKVVENTPVQMKKALVVDDVTTNRLILKFILKHQQWDVIEATSGEQALNILQQATDFDLIFMDVSMPPGLDGVETTAIIKQTLPEIPVIALTAHALVGDKERFLASGMDGYLIKPIDTGALWEEVRRLLV